MISKLVFLAAAALVVDEVAGFGGYSVVLHRPHAARRSSVNTRRLIVCQAKETVEEPAAPGPQPVATGGTSYSSLPKKQITPLFLIPSSSIVGRDDMAGDLGFDPLGLATVLPHLGNITFPALDAIATSLGFLRLHYR